MEAGLRSVVRRARWTLPLAAAAALAAGLVAPVQAATTNDTLDQSQTVMISLERTGLMAQTFTAGKSGTLDRVSLASDTSFGAATETVQIQTVKPMQIGTATVEAPSGTVLASTTTSGRLVCCSQFHDFDFTTGASITAGTQYAIVVSVVGLFTWYDSWQFDAYPGGQLFVGCIGCSWFTGSAFGRDFAFKTWVASTVNAAPTVAADNTSVTVGEGTPATNTGTFSDPDGDTVSLSASSGSVTKTGAGAWTWSEAAADESSSGQNVTVTADDGHGQTASTSFTVAVAGAAPQAQITTDPTSSPEGTPIALAGNATSPDPADNAAGFTYTWNVTKNGSPYSSGSGSSFTFTPDDEGLFVVTVGATDDGGMTGTASQTIVGTNVAPTAKIAKVDTGSPLVLTTQQSVGFTGSFSDPGVLDSHVVTWNFGDGTTSTASYGAGGAASFSASHAFSSTGSFNVTLTVADDDGGVGVASTTVVVQTPAQALKSIASYVGGLSSLTSGQRNSLEAKLNAAAASSDRGDTTAAHNQINAFLNEVAADLNAGKLSASQAATMRAAAYSVQAALGTFNRFLAWWPLDF